MNSLAVDRLVGTELDANDRPVRGRYLSPATRSMLAAIFGSAARRNSVVIPHFKERRHSDAGFASNPMAGIEVGHGHRRCLDGSSMPNQL